MRTVPFAELMWLDDLRASSPSRPPDWRWQLARYHLGARQRRAPKDFLVARLVSFLRLDARKPETAAVRIPDIAAVVGLFRDEQHRLSRWELEARLVAGQDHELIASRCGLPTNLIKIYARIFFDLPCGPASRSHYAMGVIAGYPGQSFGEVDLGFLMKVVAARRGPGGLDSFLRFYVEPTLKGRSAVAELVDQGGKAAREYLRWRQFVLMESNPVTQDNAMIWLKLFNEEESL